MLLKDMAAPDDLAIPGAQDRRSNRPEPRKVRSKSRHQGAPEKPVPGLWRLEPAAPQRFDRRQVTALGPLSHRAGIDRLDLRKQLRHPLISEQDRPARSVRRR